MRLAALLLLAACTTPTAPVQAPPPGTLVLASPGLVPGTTSDLQITGATPGARVYLGASTQAPGNGPCPAIGLGLCLDLVSPILLGTTTADGDGEAVLSIPVPSSLPVGTTVTLQAMATWSALGGAGADLSPSIQQTASLGIDDDGDGVFANVDCDDQEASVYPGATEICDGLDNDCDGTTDAPQLISSGGTNFPTIQAALDSNAASSVEVCPGTYVEQLDISDQYATNLRGIGGAASTILDANGADHGIRVFIDGEDPGTLESAWFEISGFTVRNTGLPGGNTALGAVVAEADLHLTLDDMILEDNYAAGLRAVGWYSLGQYSYVTLNDSVIRNNDAHSYGAAIHLGATRVDVNRTEITDNRTTQRGGAFYISSNGELDIRFSTVHRNHCDTEGGGAWLDRTGSLNSVLTDWGLGADANTPHDIYLLRTDATYNRGSQNFSCDGSSC